jgi:hypothetical protein
VERFANPKDHRSVLVRYTKVGMKDSLEHLWPYIVEMRGIQESFSEEERTVIARFLIAATKATHRHAEEASRRP